MLVSKLLTIYIPLIGWIGLGWILGRLLPASTPTYIGKFLFWIGVPIGIVAFLRHTQLSASLWIAPATAWTAILLGAGLAWVWMTYRQRFVKGAGNWGLGANRQTQTSFLLTSMVGNTGYIGFPVSLALVGPQYFAWAVFYDLLGSTPGAYGLGVALAAQTGTSRPDWRQPLRTMLINPALWSFGMGLVGRDVPIPALAESSLRGFAWMVVSVSLVLVGMRLSQLSSFNSVRPAVISLSIKMLLVPLVLGIGLWALGITGQVYRAILLQMAMPPAFATLVISEAYELDREMAVTAIAIGCLGLLITLPIWLWLFSIQDVATVFR
ncbi:MAG: AEC family transporter [Leptolyngbyaceae cyanobacterium RU_5_1]|nr:AEC family transporter [Leptolyngbyaceae cyanobacterium RU_5_1]